MKIIWCIYQCYKDARSLCNVVYRVLSSFLPSGTIMNSSAHRLQISSLHCYSDPFTSYSVQFISASHHWQIHRILPQKPTSSKHAANISNIYIKVNFIVIFSTLFLTNCVILTFNSLLMNSRIVLVNGNTLQ